MKKILSIITLFSIILCNQIFADNYEQEEIILKKFIVTAYYSPLPNQNFYLRGNFEDEVILNGEGKRGASGKEVYPGMLAAPKTYKFGTKIYLDGVGIGTVDDRGGAIVGSGSRGYDGDRIDIWMGYGDEGLKKALTWGKRTVYGRIVSTNNEDSLPSIALENFKIGKIDFQSLKNAQLVGKNSSINKITLNNLVVPNNISEATNKETIKYFQTILSNLGFYKGDIDGNYSDLIDKAILNFQLENNIVKTSKDRGAGYYGPKTKQVLNEKYLVFLNQEKIRIAKEKQEKENLLAIENQVQSLVKEFGTPKENEVGIHVRKLQKTLKYLGYFDGKDTAIFGKLTKESILKYQIDKGLVTKSSDIGAGMIGEKTLKKIQEDLKVLVINDKGIIKLIVS